MPSLFISYGRVLGNIKPDRRLYIVTIYKSKKNEKNFSFKSWFEQIIINTDYWCSV